MTWRDLKTFIESLDESELNEEVGIILMDRSKGWSVSSADSFEKFDQFDDAGGTELNQGQPYIKVST